MASVTGSGLAGKDTEEVLKRFRQHVVKSSDGARGWAVVSGMERPFSWVGCGSILWM